MATDETRHGIEEHLEEVLKSQQNLLKSYKKYLLNLYNFIRCQKTPQISSEEGDSYIRFKISSDYYNLSKIYYLYEIGDVIPNVRWRHLLRTRLFLAHTLLRKRSVFLPAYSFSLDRMLTFVYWGERQFFLDPEKLRDLNLSNLLIHVDKPSSVQVSAANLAWPKALENITLECPTIADITRRYLFNILLPPKLNRVYDVWDEAPFVIVGDRTVEIFTVHKTICSIDLRNAKRVGKNTLVTSAYTLDRNLEVKKIRCGVPEESINLLSRESVVEAVLTKMIRVSNLEGVKPIFRISLYPFESAKTKIFAGESPGVLATAISIVLRLLYLKSANLLKLDTNIHEVRKIVLNIFSKRPFDRYTWSSLSSQLIESDDGLKLMLKLLDIYEINQNDIIYLHPALLECLLVLVGDIENIEKNVDVNKGIRILADIMNQLDFTRKVGLTEKFEVQEKLKAITEVPSVMDLDNILRALIAAKHSFIPLSKELYGPISSSFTN